MKSLNLKLLLTVIFTCVVSMSMAQKSVKETIQEAKAILKKAGVSGIRAPLEEPLEKCSYLVLCGDAKLDGIDKTQFLGRQLKGKNMENIRAVPAGEHVLLVNYEARTGTGSGAYTGIQRIIFNFEEGKYYYLDSEITAKGKGLPGEGDRAYLFIKDLTDLKLIKNVQDFETKYKAGIPAEKKKYQENLRNANANLKRFKEDEGIKAYLTYMEANPNLLDKIVVTTLAYMEANLNKLGETSTANDAFLGNFLRTKGRLLYNENTIVMIDGKSYTSDQTLFKGFVSTYIWYYTTKDDTLHLERDLTGVSFSSNLTERSRRIGWDLIRYLALTPDWELTPDPEEQEFQAYQEANPSRLDGTWKGEKKRLMNIFSMQYSIDGNRMKFEGKSKHTGKTFVAEGAIRYNENTLIFTPEKAAIDGKEVQDFYSEDLYVWHYTLTGKELHLEGGRLFGKMLIWENTGEFHKSE